MFSTLTGKFLAKNQKVFEVGENRKYDERKDFEKKTLSSLKSIFTKISGKYAGGSRPFC